VTDAASTSALSLRGRAGVSGGCVRGSRGSSAPCCNRRACKVGRDRRPDREQDRPTNSVPLFHLNEMKGATEPILCIRVTDFSTRLPVSDKPLDSTDSFRHGQHHQSERRYESFHCLSLSAYRRSSRPETHRDETATRSIPAPDLRP